MVGKCPYEEAAVKIFRITENETYFLFSPLSYPQNKLRGAAAEKFVAKRIRDLVAGKIEAPERTRQ